MKIYLLQAEYGPAYECWYTCVFKAYADKNTAELICSKLQKLINDELLSAYKEIMECQFEPLRKWEEKNPEPKSNSIEEMDKWNDEFLKIWEDANKNGQEKSHALLINKKDLPFLEKFKKIFNGGHWVDGIIFSIKEVELE